MFKKKQQTQGVYFQVACA